MLCSFSVPIFNTNRAIWHKFFLWDYGHFYPLQNCALSAKIITIGSLQRTGRVTESGENLNHRPVTER